jgi:hypothetical protein
VATHIVTALGVTLCYQPGAVDAYEREDGAVVGFDVRIWCPGGKFVWRLIA